MPGPRRRSLPRDALSAFRTAQDVSVQSLLVVPDLLRSFGVEPEPILARAKVDPRWMRSSAGRIPLDAAHRVAFECVKATGCPHFGLLVGQRVGTAAMGTLAELARHSTTVRSALRMLCAHLHVQDRGAVAYLREPNTREVEFVYQIFHPHAPGRDQLLDVALCIMVAFMRSLCGPNWAPSAVEVAHGSPQQLAPYHGIFSVPVRFDAPRTALVFPKRLLDRRIDGAQSTERKRLAGLVADIEASAPPTVTEYVARALARMVLDAPPSEERLARMLRTSQRTLRRRLKAEGNSVKVLVAEVRGELARQLLAETTMPVNEIASTLNYAGPGIFSRAFRSWTGTTPRAYRTAALRKLGAPADAYPQSSKT
jgi:AraC-like DNA-binding protein